MWIQHLGKISGGLAFEVIFLKTAPHLGRFILAQMGVHPTCSPMLVRVFYAAKFNLNAIAHTVVTTYDTDFKLDMGIKSIQSKTPVLDPEIVHDFLQIPTVKRV